MLRNSAGRWPAIVVCGVLLSAGCAAGSVVDLTAAFEHSEIFVETGTIDLGDSAARRHLVDGWSPLDERWAQREDETFVWSRGTHAALRFFQIESRLQRVRFRGRPDVSGGETSVSRIYLRLNGVTLPTAVEVVAGWEDYVVPLPARFLKIGANLLTFGFDQPPAEEPSRGASLQFAFDHIRFFDATVTALPRLEQASSEQGLLLPYLSGIIFNLDLLPGAVVHIRQIQAYGRPLPETGTLHVYIDADDRQEHHIVEVPVTGIDIPIDVDAAAPVRLSLMSLPPPSFYRLQGHAAEQDVGLRLEQPIVRQPQ